MYRRTIGTVCLTLLLAGAATARTPEQACQTRKMMALAKRDFCVQKALAQGIVGKEAGEAPCFERFARRLASAEQLASCRWLEHGDGTATDLDTGLQWELKGDLNPAAAVEHMFVNSHGDPPSRYGLVSEYIVNSLNRGDSDGSTTEGCLGGKCDWRLPTVEELATLVDPTCSDAPCTTIPGETASGPDAEGGYWTSSRIFVLPGVFWSVSPNDGRVILTGIWSGNQRPVPHHLRAVRGP